MIMLQYLITIFFHAVDPNNRLIVGILWLNAFYFLTLEIVSIRLNGLYDYITDLWNYLDLALLSSLALYLATFSFNEKAPFTEYQSKLLGVTNVISWFRGMNHLKAFESARIFIYLVVAIIADLKAFVLIVFCAIIQFSTTAFILLKPNNTEDSESKFFDSLWNTFQLTIGEYSLDDLDTFGKLLFVVEAFFMNIILLNLIIALMSDTYENVMTNIQELDGRQLNELIIECENYLFWKRSWGKPQHLFWVDYQTESNGAWASSADYITTTIDNTKKEIMALQ